MVQKEKMGQWKMGIERTEEERLKLKRESKGSEEEAKFFSSWHISCGSAASRQENISDNESSQCSVYI